MKNLNSYKKIAKEFIKEAAWDRKFGEPLPTLEDVMKENFKYRSSGDVSFENELRCELVKRSSFAKQLKYY